MFLQNERSFTFFISEHFHLPTEHGFQYGVLSGKHLQCSVEQVSAHIKPDILVAQAYRSSITAGLGLGTGQGKGLGNVCVGLSVMSWQAAVP